MQNVSDYLELLYKNHGCTAVSAAIVHLNTMDILLKTRDYHKRKWIKEKNVDVYSLILFRKGSKLINR